MTTEPVIQPGPVRADAHDVIRVQGARENNLKNISVDLPETVARCGADCGFDAGITPTGRMTP